MGISEKGIESFLNVANAKSFSAAATIIGVSQPTLTRHIRELEESLGAALLYRNGRGALLTDAGQRFYHEAAELQKHFAAARQTVRKLELGSLRQAAVGMPSSIARAYIGPITEAIYALNAEIKLRFVEAATGHLLSWLEEGRLDAAVVQVSEKTQRFRVHHLTREPLYLIRSADGRPPPPTTPFHCLAEVPLVLPSRAHGLRKHLESIAAAQKISLTVTVEGDGLWSVISILRSGRAASIIPLSTAIDELTSGKLVASRIVEPMIDRALVVVTPKSRNSNVEPLVQLIKSQFRPIEAGEAVPAPA